MSMRSAVCFAWSAILFGMVIGPVKNVAAAEGDRRSISRTDVNVRSSPDINASIVRTINPGEVLIEIDYINDWYLVELLDRNQKGWIYGPLLDEEASEDAGNGTSAPFSTRIAATPSTPPSTPAEPSNEALAELDAALERDLAAVAETRPSQEVVRGKFSGDPVEGEKVFYKCGACHTVTPGVNGDGPSLVGVFGNRPAQASGFGYSSSMRAFAADGAVWDEVTLDEFIRRPGRVVRGTSMPFSGVRDPKQRRDLIAFLQQLN